VMKRSRFYPRPAVVSGAVSAVGQAGGVLLTETIRAAGLDVGLIRLPISSVMIAASSSARSANSSAARNAIFARPVTGRARHDEYPR